MDEKSIAFVLSSLSAGGMEQVMVQLANYFAQTGVAVEFILLSKKPHFFTLHPAIDYKEPKFTIDQMSRILFQWRDFWYLRKQLKKLKAQHVLTFGGKYNSFVLLAGLGLKKKIFISDRSRPTISYGRFLDAINPRVYHFATGIIAQTDIAKKILEQKIRHSNIKVISNPLPRLVSPAIRRNLVILNVGRFITSKHQDWLIDYFDELAPERWSLIFLGAGPQFEKIQAHRAGKSSKHNISLKGNVKNVETYYAKASIFAFTSTSEGFPNALAEAMSAGCACISFDCMAGPADLIDDGVNGFLIPVGDHEQYKIKLQLLIDDASLRERFRENARKKMEQFDLKLIAQQYLDFMLTTS